MLKQSGENIVLATSLINPLMFNEKWLIDNEIVKSEEIIAGKTIVTNVFSIVHCEGFRIQVLNNQYAVFIEKIEYAKEFQEKVVSIIKGIITSTNSPVFMAIGINFIYETGDLDNPEEITRKLHFTSENKLHSALDSKNMRFGSYTSMDYEGSRLRLDIKPQYNGISLDKEKLNASFNYGLTLTSANALKESEEVLLKWGTYKAHSLEVSQKINDIIK